VSGSLSKNRALSLGEKNALVVIEAIFRLLLSPLKPVGNSISFGVFQDEKIKERKEQYPNIYHSSVIVRFLENEHPCS